MNTLLKNLKLDYNSPQGHYPTDESFIKAWESADWIEDLDEKFDYDFTQSTLAKSKRLLALYKEGKQQLEEKGSVPAFVRSHRTDDNRPYIRRIRLFTVEHATNKDAEIKGDKTEAYHSELRYSSSSRWEDFSYFFFRKYDEVVQELSTDIDELEADIETIENGFTYSCYSGGTRTIRNKETRIEEKYNITLKSLKKRPNQPKFDARAFLTACRHNFNEFDKQRNSAA